MSTARQHEALSVYERDRQTVLDAIRVSGPSTIEALATRVEGDLHLKLTVEFHVGVLELRGQVRRDSKGRVRVVTR